MDNKKFLRDFINDYCIVRCPPGYYIKGCLPGQVYSWQFYLRNAIYFAPALVCIVEEFNRHIDSEKFQYAAMESAGPPILTAIQMLRFATNPKEDFVSFAIRKERKKYGMMNWFEGMPGLDKSVVLIDDISNSKSTLIRAKQIVEDHGLNVDHALSIIDKKGIDNVSGLPVNSIFSIDDFDLTWESYGKNLSVEKFVETYANVLYKQVSDSVIEPVGAASTEGFPEINTFDIIDK